MNNKLQNKEGIKNQIKRLRFEWMVQCNGAIIYAFHDNYSLKQVLWKMDLAELKPPVKKDFNKTKSVFLYPTDQFYQRVEEIQRKEDPGGGTLRRLEGIQEYATLQIILSEDSLIYNNKLTKQQC